MNKESIIFLKTVYEQCNLVYITFVNVRFQIFSIFASNAALFYFIYRHEEKAIALILFVSITAIFFSWVLFFIDHRNKYIFRRAVRISSIIEAYFGIQVDMRLHTKTPIDLKYKISHSKIFFILTITFTFFWIFFIFFHDLFVTVN